MSGLSGTHARNHARAQHLRPLLTMISSWSRKATGGQEEHTAKKRKETRQTEKSLRGQSQRQLKRRRLKSSTQKIRLQEGKRAFTASNPAPQPSWMCFMYRSGPERRGLHLPGSLLPSSYSFGLSSAERCNVKHALKDIRVKAIDEW